MRDKPELYGRQIRQMIEYKIQINPDNSEFNYRRNGLQCGCGAVWKGIDFISTVRTKKKENPFVL